MYFLKNRSTYQTTIVFIFDWNQLFYLKVIVLFTMSIFAILLKVLHLQLSQFMIKFLI